MRFHAVTEAMLLGVGLTALAQGTLVGVALAIAGFDHALFWGSVTAAVSILPMFGSAVVWGPASVILAAQGRGGTAMLLASFGILIVSNVDNVLRLIVYRRVSQIAAIDAAVLVRPRATQDLSFKGRGYGTDSFHQSSGNGSHPLVDRRAAGAFPPDVRGQSRTAHGDDRVDARDGDRRER
jgi:hypothetical protein